MTLILSVSVCQTFQTRPGVKMFGSDSSFLLATLDPPLWPWPWYRMTEKFALCGGLYIEMV